MPELPEVQTTVNGLQKVISGLIIRNVWTDWKKLIKDQKFSEFRKMVVGKRILNSKRRGKNILINLSGNKTILVHLKMTGHLMFGHYELKNNIWTPHSREENKALSDPYNRFIHFVFTFSNGKHLVFSDLRKFGKIVLLPTDGIVHSPHLSHLGPEPLEKRFTYKIFKERIQKKLRGKIKTVLMDQTVISGIGNIYSDEILFQAGVNPEQRIGTIPEKILRKIFSGIKTLLKKGISLGGDSTSDYRNVFGERGNFQEKHQVYRRKGLPCFKHDCNGIIIRKVVGGRSSHFCPKHQQLIL
jgi:formamidopyrimidine-DNA glycosylase